jgi:hypothetical protein
MCSGAASTLLGQLQLQLAKLQSIAVTGASVHYVRLNLMIPCQRGDVGSDSRRYFNPNRLRLHRMHHPAPRRTTAPRQGMCSPLLMAGDSAQRPADSVIVALDPLQEVSAEGSDFARLVVAEVDHLNVLSRPD